MLSIQHVLCLWLYCTECDLGEPRDEAVAAVVYPDAIRAYTKVRGYSHFEVGDDGDRSYMKFPCSMKADQEEVSSLLNKFGHLAHKDKVCAIDNLTGEQGVELCIQKNSTLDDVMLGGIVWHLRQDTVFDDFIREVIDCSKMKKDVYTVNGKILNGKELRGLIHLIEMHGIYALAKRLYLETNMTVNNTWLKIHIERSLKNSYNEELADKTFSFMKIDDDIDRYITNHDWSHIGEGLPIKYRGLSGYDMYMSLYDMVITSMRRRIKRRIPIDGGVDEIYELQSLADENTFYDLKTGIMHISFGLLESSKVLKLMLRLMVKHDAIVMGIYFSEGVYTDEDVKSLAEGNPNKSWSYSLIKKQDVLNKPLSSESKLGIYCYEFKKKYNIEGNTILLSRLLESDDMQRDLDMLIFNSNIDSGKLDFSILGFGVSEENEKLIVTLYDIDW